MVDKGAFITQEISQQGLIGGRNNKNKYPGKNN
jgi:hypothetical protein